MKPLHVEPDSMRDAGDTIDRASDDVDEAANRADSGSAQPWGADLLGSAIGSCFTPAFELAFDCVDANLVVLRDYAEKLRTMAGSYDRTEDENGRGMTEVRRQFDNRAGR
ncbi:type VII secretion target [Catenuloplanes japonicus]|uniref:type VII secretion target n=1 Tax=Catenuloplanes japonicus TaxID=33876 RepID=UPI000525D575|nr:type VII secretion target [Catenuloplanes japonicus]